ncbi:MAG: SdiA-regulated domain-containing protein [Lewinellaceae bacterium]|nr:SdiA-regulated domain-containing protein [Saprospiraceae bacterium]MCB9337452.1 SdiA-regulated domain-containing protein [Lewinellaceae bacterium]
MTKLVLLSCLAALPFFNLENTHPIFPYDLDEPNVSFEMPESLKEISGLSMTADGQHLAAVNDEEGKIFILDKMTGEITGEYNFWDDGDYEGIEVVGDDCWVMKSSGTLYQVKNYASKDRLVNKFRSFLNKANDIEGLAYDPVKNSLLIGCKGKAYENDDHPHEKAIYEFKLDELMVMNEPVYLLTLPDMREYLDHLQGGEKDHLDKLQEIFSEQENEMIFSPSGIAVHPLTDEIYVTSSKGKMLLVLDRQGHIVYLEKLKKKIHQQPEGICFDADGTLFIANEGKDGKAKLYKYRYRKQ